MTLKTELTEKIVDLCRALVDQPLDLVEEAVDAASDHLSNRDASDDLVLESLLDGIRWGHRAAQTVDREGGTMLRLAAPGGFRLSHEWLEPLTEAQQERMWRSISEALSDQEKASCGTHACRA